MAEHLVYFDALTEPVRVPTGTLLAEAARMAGLEIGQPCGGQGRCGRCTVQVLEGNVRRRSTLRLSAEDVAQGFALACQTVVEGDCRVSIPPQEKIERRLTTDRTVSEITVPPGYNYELDQTIRRVHLTLSPPSLEDQTDDLSRLLTALKQQAGFTSVSTPLPILRKLGEALRAGDWNVTAIIDVHDLFDGRYIEERLVDLLPGRVPQEEPIWGAAIDIGTTTVTVWLVNLLTGQVEAQASEYNGQIARGEDVISRIVYASKNGGAAEMRNLVLDTINQLLATVCQRYNVRKKDWESKASPEQIVKATIAGNSTMMHLFLGIPASSIRLSPYITAVNHVPLLSGQEVGLNINPLGIVDCLPGVASYVGSDITAGVLASGMDDTNRLTLFMDVGTNGEIVLGSNDWLVACACSAGPAFEGAGVYCGMRATRGAIEEVWINGETFEPTYRVIGGGKPSGICGSGLISLLAEMFMTGVIDKAGNLNTQLGCNRIREGEYGLEYVIAWGEETQTGKDITITHVDIDNLLRAKGAIYAGYSVLADSVGVPLEMIEQMLIGGSFGKYINVEKAIQIGLLPDMPWEKFQFLGNTSVRGAYYALLDHRARARIKEIATRMTYIELSADNSFYEAFMSALFLPHTDLNRFPSIAQALKSPASAG
ncbi:MAG: ASKHA domain-containing protein [Anaerolineales bacterium]|nr:ASKHA domain-containing protein [Anaerolineales bacterium]